MDGTESPEATARVRDGDGREEGIATDRLWRLLVQLDACVWRSMPTEIPGRERLGAWEHAAKTLLRAQTAVGYLQAHLPALPPASLEPATDLLDAAEAALAEIESGRPENWDDVGALVATALAATRDVLES